MRPSSLALLYPGDRAARDRSDPAESRFAALFAAFAAAGIDAAPAVYHDDFADEVEAQLRGVRLVLVWCNPIEGGRRRDRLDALLRRVADAGVVVSSHPDAVLGLGTKDVLVATRGLPFGSDVHRVDSLAQLEADLPHRLRGGPRVLKQYRGHSGIGIWRVERDGLSQGLLRVRHAQRGSEDERIDLAALLERMAPYFEPANGGHMVDQAWQPRLPEGMVRAYMVGDRVGGFGHQAVVALHPSAEPGPRLYHGPELARFQDLRRKLEGEWVQLLLARVGLPEDKLPLLWDCDFLLGEGAHEVDSSFRWNDETESPSSLPLPSSLRRQGSTLERYVLCEINVSSVSPFPPSCIPAIVAAVRERLAA